MANVIGRIQQNPTAYGQPSQSLSQKIGGVAKGVGNFLTGSTQQFGQTIGGAVAAPANADLYTQALQANTSMQNSLHQAIKNSQTQGKDTTKLQAALQQTIASTPKLEDFTGSVINTTPEQVIGQGIGTGLEALSGGILQSGAENIATKGASIGSKIAQGAKIGATYGGISGLSSGMQQNKNLGGVVDSTALGAGSGAVVGGAIGGIGGVISNKISSTSKLDTAIAERDATAQSAVKNLQEATGSVGDFKNDLGTSFVEGAQKVETENPGLTMTLSSDQVDALNTLKNNKSFALPDYIREPNLPSEIENVGSGEIKLTPTQAQDLITQLNKSTFTEKANGLAVDQSKIGLTNEIKSAASDAFGSKWDRVYSNYSQGINAVNKISDIINLDKNATASDVNKNVNAILKLSDTPEGKIILQNAVNEFKNVSGIDLTDPTNAVAQILDKEHALQLAQKPSLLKQAFNPVYLTRAAIRLGLIYTGYKLISGAIQKALKP